MFSFLYYTYKTVHIQGKPDEFLQTKHTKNQHSGSPTPVNIYTTLVLKGNLWLDFLQKKICFDLFVLYINEI